MNSATKESTDELKTVGMMEGWRNERTKNYREFFFGTRQCPSNHKIDFAMALSCIDLLLWYTKVTDDLQMVVKNSLSFKKIRRLDSFTSHDFLWIICPQRQAITVFNDEASEA